jgi:branched-chain amino acid transport system substrate-binding protein
LGKLAVAISFHQCPLLRTFAGSLQFQELSCREAYYADNACDPAIGVPATRRLIEQERVSVVIGALCTPVTHAIMPMIAEAKVPLVIATTAGQDFVDASGVGGNEYPFKTIPPEVDVARGLMRSLTSQNVGSIAIVAAADPLPARSRWRKLREMPVFG